MIFSREYKRNWKWGYDEVSRILAHTFLGQALLPGKQGL
jgi:hypothetical protein